MTPPGMNRKRKTAAFSLVVLQWRAKRLLGWLNVMKSQRTMRRLIPPEKRPKKATRIRNSNRPTRMLRASGRRQPTGKKLTPRQRRERVSFGPLLSYVANDTKRLAAR